jgi:hypothetical protein
MISGSGRRPIDVAAPRRVVAAQRKRPREGGRLDFSDTRFGGSRLGFARSRHQQFHQLSRDRDVGSWHTISISLCRRSLAAIVGFSI